MTFSKTSIGLLSAALSLAAFSSGPPLEDGDVLLSEARLGEYWAGAEVGLPDLEGKVVLIELWGS